MARHRPLVPLRDRSGSETQALTVEAAVTGKCEHVYHAAMLDPHTAAELDLDQIWPLVDELLRRTGVGYRPS